MNPNLKKALEMIAEGKRVLPVDKDGNVVTWHKDFPDADPWDDATSDPAFAYALWLIHPEAIPAEVKKPDEEPGE